LDDVSIAGARGLLINVTGSPMMTLTEVCDAANTIYESSGADANVIFGMAIDESMNDEIRVTVIATGMGQKMETAERHASERPQAGRPSSAPFERVFKRRETQETDGGIPVSVDAGLDVDYDTPAFLRRHSG
jgi:cell division protein FtsZ